MCTTRDVSRSGSHRGCGVRRSRADDADAALSTTHQADWSFSSDDAASAHHALGLASYDLLVQPFDAELGDLYSAEFEASPRS